MRCTPEGMCVVDSFRIEMEYDFAGNVISVVAEGVYDYVALLSNVDSGVSSDKYDMTSRLPASSVRDYSGVGMESLRKMPLTMSDSLLYVSNGVMDLYGGDADSVASVIDEEYGIKRFLWSVGGGAVSSHTLAWGDSDLKLSPLVNPSYLSYSSSKGVSYKLSFNLRSRFPKGRFFELKPMVGYASKHNEFYWDVSGIYSFAPLRRGAVVLDVGRGSSVYSSALLDIIKNTSLDSLRFDRLPIIYYRDFHVTLDARLELVNGLELLAGANFYRRSLYGSAVGMEIGGARLEKRYRQLAPHVRLTWQPGMYYYISGGRKINVGSRAPRLSLDVEQGIGGVLQSHGIYTRAEFDVQHKYRLSPSASLYLRAGAGGYFRTEDVYFVNYVFLKDNLLPIDKEDEMSGVFHLLDREWYNAANHYLRLNTGYESPFLFLQRVVPQVDFIKSESLYAGMLFISHLCPYWECGYGVETPYVNLGVFSGFEMFRFHKIGFKVTFSLFD